MLLEKSLSFFIHATHMLVSRWKDISCIVSCMIIWLFIITNYYHCHLAFVLAEQTIEKQRWNELYEFTETTFWASRLSIDASLKVGIFLLFDTPKLYLFQGETRSVVLLSDPHLRGCLWNDMPFIQKENLYIWSLSCLSCDFVVKNVSM